MTPLERLTVTKLHQREQLCQHEDLRLASTLAQEFRQMLKKRQGELLPDWRVSGKSLADCLHSRVLPQASPAIMPLCLRLVPCLGVTPVVEGTIHRWKYLKRQMFGRAQLDLLRIKVLHAV
jgi:hypothetical protein